MSAWMPGDGDGAGTAVTGGDAVSTTVISEAPDGSKENTYDEIWGESSTRGLVPMPKEPVISAAFVVTFDVKRGNIVEWIDPPMDPTGLEFKALVSGSHNVKKDFVFFRHRALYGLSCFEQLTTGNAEERGARTKSVGFLSTDFRKLHEHLQFLETEVMSQLRSPTSYDRILEYVQDANDENRLNAADLSSLEGSGRMLIAQSRSCSLSQFIQFFGPNVFPLWKAALLRRRILFYSLPPISAACFRVFWTSVIGSLVGCRKDVQFPKGLHLRFYVNVEDIDSLSKANSYIGCTTEKIFIQKDRLYDVFVENQMLMFGPKLGNVCKLSDADKQRFAELQKLIERYTDIKWQQRDCAIEEYFFRLNRRLFSKLFHLSTATDGHITEEHVRSMGLHPLHDMRFLSALVELYGYDLNWFVNCC